MPTGNPLLESFLEKRVFGTSAYRRFSASKSLLIANPSISEIALKFRGIVLLA
jgi:hypothetical protein